MPRPPSVRLLLPLLGCALLAGCSSAGGMLGTGPRGNRLIPAAKDLRDAAPDPAPVPRELDKRVAPLYVVAPGDVLLVQPANLDSPLRLPGDQAVLPDGTIHLGRYGLLQVAGKTIPQIEADARTLIESQTKDAGPITARLVTRVSKVYYVIGEVNAPGAFPLQGRETVLDGIFAAGGLNERASRHNIILVRPTPPDSGRIVLPVCWHDITQVGDTTTNYQLAAGDRIYVPTRQGREECKQRKKPCGPCGKPQFPLSPTELGPGCPLAGTPGGELPAPTLVGR